jgi:NAD(P)-dependent dehydrogenase (short-subunit alcohol dehydrogenase family)
VHLLFNNAGVGSGGLIWENTEADWEWVLGVNVWGVIHGVRIFTKLMLECAKDPAFEGHIVNTASMAGLLNAPTMGVYNVSKHAVVSLSETCTTTCSWSKRRSGPRCCVRTSCRPASACRTATVRTTSR